MERVLRSGKIRASGYANKLRRTAFAALKDKLPAEEIVRAVGELNKKIFEVLRATNVRKDYIISIEAPFDIEFDENGQRKIKWDYDNVKIYVFVPMGVIKGLEKPEFKYTIPTEGQEFREDYDTTGETEYPT
ncbi:single- stranded DNA-binding family protein [Pyrococcus kukulkanii]|uniref:DUF2258 domain-containing protein n=1 Tax=Pyrococcus kukulkanii TaxID=1609559 RepID=A0ABV4T640_9EURY